MQTTIKLCLHTISSGCLIDNKMRLKFEFYVDSFWALTSARDVVWFMHI